jgi:hypothetical protein
VKIDMNDENKNIESSLAGQVLSVWMPIGFWRKLIFILLVFFGALGVIKSAEWYHWAMLVFAATMSPRLMGEVIFTVGRLAAFLSKK